MSKKPHAAEVNEQAILANATLWTAFVQMAPGDRRRAEFGTRQDAEEFAVRAASEMRRSIMVYGITKEGRSALARVARPGRAA